MTDSTCTTRTPSRARAFCPDCDAGADDSMVYPMPYHRCAGCDQLAGPHEAAKPAKRFGPLIPVALAVLALVLAGLSLHTRAATLGPELVENGGFDTADGWSLGYGWGISPGAPPAQGLAYHNEGGTSAISRAPAYVPPAGATLRVVYTISGSAGSSDPRHAVRIRGASGAAFTPIVSGDGTFTFDIAAPADTWSIDLFAFWGCACVADNLSVRVLTP
jgi:hypothetical protein